MAGVLIPSVAAGSAEKYRGGWAPDELVWSEDFAGGVPSGPGWSVAGSPVVASVLMSTLGGGYVTGVAPGYSHALSIYGGSFANRDVLLDVSQVEEIADLSLTRVVFEAGIHDDTWGNTNFTFQVDGANSGTLGASDVAPWTHFDVALAGDHPVLKWRRSGTDNDGHGYVFVAGVRIYAQSDPYMLGELVTWKGQVWKTTVDNNGSEPGTDATWELVGTDVLVGYDPVYNTATRPAAADAGEGGRIWDRDLNKPLWSDGAAWVDATGTAV